MLSLLAVLLPFVSASRRSPPDPEKGGHPETSPEPETRPPSEYDGPEHGYDEDEDDLDREHDSDDIIHDMEVEHDSPPDSGGAPRRKRSYSSFLTVTSENPKPSWYLKLQGFLSPNTTHQDLEAYVPNYRTTKSSTKQPNPMILNIGLGFSMACALVANICLVVRFLETKIKLMTVGCIIFLTVHDVINIIAVTTFGVEHRFNDGFTYGQSFWMTVCSTIVSTFTNFTLITDLLRTPDFENSGSGLTRRQRSLVILVILLLCYIALGALIHSYLLSLNFIDAMYFTLVSIETIGFGDIKPHTIGARFFTCIYAALGIVCIALTVGLTRETVLEGLEVGYRKRVQAVRQRRKVGRWKRRVSNRWREAVEWRLRESGHPVFWTFWMDWLPWPTGESTSFTYGSGFMLGHGLGYGKHPHGMHLNLEALSWKQLEAAAMEAGVPLDTLLPDGFRERHQESEDGSSHEEHRPGPAPDANIPLTHARLGRMITMVGSFALAVNKSGHLTRDSPVINPPSNSRGTGSAPTPQFRKSLTLQYDAFRSGMEKEEAKAFYARLVVVWVLFIMFWMIGSVIFMTTEKWSFGVSLYFCFIAFTTIGYGDYSPETPAGRSVFVVWALLGVGTMTILISVISEAFSSKYHSALHAGIFERAVKRYRERARALAERTRRGKKQGVPISGLPRPPLSEHQSTDDVLKEVHTRTQTQLEALPHKILADAKTFHEHLSYFVGAGNKVKVDSGDDLPPGLQRLMNEITGAQKLGERIKREILQDEDARHTLFTLSIEHALRNMINSAEAAVQAIEEREQLLQQRQGGNWDGMPVQDISETPNPASGSGEEMSRNLPRRDTTESDFSLFGDWTR
ncbi:hypothetical protein B0H14DRAFT_2729837 [Mycena olivaceomarginata]|nr:hypothetical protein B0H14DRAFT_2729837 [Mycena olivaceomarginata]